MSHHDTRTLGYLDRLSELDTPVHRTDSRAKLFTTLVFVVTVVSFGKYEISALIPFLLYPVVLAALGNLPLNYLAGRIAVVAPFAVLVAVFNPILDREPMLVLGGLRLSGGWVSFISIVLRFVLTVGAALILLATTGMNRVCHALEKMGVPRVFTGQLLFLYRYLFTLAEETVRMTRAISVRTAGRSNVPVRAYGSAAGHLLLRTLDRAQRVYAAMCCRGFDGHIRTMRTERIRSTDILFVSGWSALFVLMRLHNVPRILGRLFMEVIQ